MRWRALPSRSSEAITGALAGFDALCRRVRRSRPSPDFTRASAQESATSDAALDVRRAPPEKAQAMSTGVAPTGAGAGGSPPGGAALSGDAAEAACGGEYPAAGCAGAASRSDRTEDSARSNACCMMALAPARACPSNQHRLARRPGRPRTRLAANLA